MKSLMKAAVIASLVAVASLANANPAFLGLANNILRSTAAKTALRLPPNANALALSTALGNMSATHAANTMRALLAWNMSPAIANGTDLENAELAQRHLATIPQNAIDDILGSLAVAMGLSRDSFTTAVVGLAPTPLANPAVACDELGALFDGATRDTPVEGISRAGFVASASKFHVPNAGGAGCAIENGVGNLANVSAVAADSAVMMLECADGLDAELDPVGSPARVDKVASCRIAAVQTAQGIAAGTVAGIRSVTAQARGFMATLTAAARSSAQALNNCFSGLGTVAAN